MIKFIKFFSLSLFKLALVTSVLVLGFMSIPISYVWNIHGKVEPSTYHGVMMTVVSYIADGNDTVTVDIDSPGGYAYYGIRISNTLMSTRAHTISYNRGMAASAAAIIAFSTKEKVQAKYSFYMFHRPYTMTLEGRKLVPNTNPVQIIFNRFMSDRVYKYLNKNQRAAYRRGRDIYMYRVYSVKVR